ncbi:MAG TPA: hypothetical protein VF172_11245 [Nitrososphaera sp.]
MAVIKLGNVFSDAAALDVAQQGVKIFLYFVVANHVFYGSIVINVIVMLSLLPGI